MTIALTAIESTTPMELETAGIRSSNATVAIGTKQTGDLPRLFTHCGSLGEHTRVGMLSW